MMSTSYSEEGEDKRTAIERPPDIHDLLRPTVLRRPFGLLPVERVNLAGGQDDYELVVESTDGVKEVL